MTKVCLVNGSLRGAKAASLQFLQAVQDRLGAGEFVVRTIVVKAGIGEAHALDTLKALAEADAIVFAFPLFSYTLPGALIRLLEEFYAYARAPGNRVGSPRVYAIVNNGFPQARINEEAVRVITNFCTRLGFQYGFSIAISGGPVTVLTMKAPMLNPRLKRAFALMARDMKSSQAGAGVNRYFDPIIPKGILLWIKAQYEKKMKISADLHPGTEKA
jgi:multimeric flavodoxin WrbA